jgi:hypothetical protein
LITLVVIAIDAGVHFEHVQVSKSVIGTESAERCEDDSNEPISRNELKVRP